MKYECEDCGFEWGEDSVATFYDACPRCKSEKIKNKTIKRLDFLEEYCEELEKKTWELEEKINILEEEVERCSSFNGDEFRPVILEYVQAFIADHVKEWKN